MGPAPLPSPCCSPAEGPLFLPGPQLLPPPAHTATSRLQRHTLSCPRPTTLVLPGHPASRPAGCAGQGRPAIRPWPLLTPDSCHGNPFFLSGSQARSPCGAPPMMFLPSVSGRVAWLPTSSLPPDAHVAACGYWEEPAEGAGRRRGAGPGRAVPDVSPWFCFPPLPSHRCSARAVHPAPTTCRHQECTGHPTLDKTETRREEVTRPGHTHGGIMSVRSQEPSEENVGPGAWAGSRAHTLKFELL